MNSNDHPIHARLLRLFREHRFLTTHQVARLTQQEYGSLRSAARQTRRHLTRLHQRRLITRLERRVGGWQGGSSTTIWTLTGAGLRHAAGSRGIRRPHHVSTTFLEHHLAVAEACVVLHEITQQYPKLHVKAVGEPGCWRRHLNGQGALVTLKPDLAITVTSPAFVDHYFFEVDRATENPARVIRQCWRYVLHRRSGAEQTQHGVYPVVVWIVPHEKRKAQLQTAIKAEALPQELFMVLVLDELAPLIRDGPPQAADA